MFKGRKEERKQQASERRLRYVHNALDLYKEKQTEKSRLYVMQTLKELMPEELIEIEIELIKAGIYD